MSNEEQYALRSAALTKRYRRKAALRDCTVQVPTGRVSALVGPNGAGKTTLMSLACGLLEPSGGEISVLGQQPGKRGLVAGLGYLAQDKPLYPSFTVDEMVRAGVHLNPGFDDSYARRLIEEAEVSLTARIKTLSGGQATRVALAMAMGRRPRLLILDEPLADLDPLARKAVTQTLMTEVAETGTTVLLSSHVMSDLEEVCDHLVLLMDGRVRLCGDVDDLLTEHHLATGPATDAPPFAAGNVVEHNSSPRGSNVMLRDAGVPAVEGWETNTPTLEELVLAYMRTDDQQGGTR